MKAYIVLTIIGATVALATWFPRLMLNPGQLSQGHQKIENHCTSCHKLFWGLDDARCIACHKPGEIGKDSSGTVKAAMEFHTSLKGQSCTSCHTDHKGIDRALATIAFDHSQLTAVLLANCSGCHNTPTDSLHTQLSVTCGSCHNTSNWKLEGPFDHALIKGTSQNSCISCHKKPADELHLSVQNNCADCHSTSEWSPATFDHDKYFILDRDHNVKCITCHTDNNFKAYSCYGCHEHTPANVAEEHHEENIYNFDDCVSCHRSGDKHDIRREGNGNNQNRERIRNYVESEKNRERKNGHPEHDD